MKGQRPIFRPTRPLPMKLWACLGITDELCSLHWTRANAVKWRSLAGCEWRTGFQIVRVEVSKVKPTKKKSWADYYSITTTRASKHLEVTPKKGTQ